MLKMKHSLIYAFFVASALSILFGSCKTHEIEEDMTDSVKLELLDINLEKHPNDPKLLAARAQVLFNLHRTKEANYDINRAVELDPDNTGYLLLQADITFANGDVQGSYKALENAEKIDPKAKDIQLKMGEIMFYNRDYDRSLKCLSNVTAQDPNNRTALFMKGFIYKEKGDTANAIQLLHRVCDKFPDYAPAFEELGILYASVGNPLALEYLSTTLQLEPSNTHAMYALAMFHQDHEQMEQAEEIYRRILDINENSADAWHNLGWIELTYYRDYQRAIEYFDKALAADPSHQGAITNRQLAQQALGINQ